jgi:hypothetical protein
VAESKIPRDWKPVIEASIVSRRVEETLVLVHLSTDSIYELSRTGGRLWELFEQGCTYGDAVRELQAEFEVAHEEVEREAERFVQMLVSEGVIAQPAGI